MSERKAIPGEELRSAAGGYEAPEVEITDGQPESGGTVNVNSMVQIISNSLTMPSTQSFATPTPSVTTIVNGPGNEGK